MIFVTALNADDDEEHGLALDAADDVTKPVQPALPLARVHAQLELTQARDRLAHQNAFLDAELRRRMAGLIKNLSLFALATLAETRDSETGNHLRRTQACIEVQMNRLRDHPRYARALAAPDVRQRIAKAAPLHDIGLNPQSPSTPRSAVPTALRCCARRCTRPTPNRPVGWHGPWMPLIWQTLWPC